MMALTGRKLCKLDAICAKLKQINQEPAHKHKDETRSVPNSGVANYGNLIETQDEPADLSIKPKKCLNNNIEDYSIHNEHKEIDAQDLTVLNSNTNKTGTDLYGSNKTSEDINHSSSESKIQQTRGDGDASSPREGISSSSIKSSPTLTPVGSSRRKSRKASTPRNIAQIQKTYDHFDHVDEKDELAEYEINNQNTDFPPEEVEEENDKISYNSSYDSLGGSNESLETPKSSKELDKSSDFSKSSEVYSLNNGAPLDLSVGKNDEQSSNNDYLTSDEEDDGFSADRNLVIDESDNEKMNTAKSQTPSESKRDLADSKAHAAHLKDYAESTMNELISMYGFSRPGLSSDIVRHFPISSYDSIMQQVNGLMPLKKEPLESTTSPGKQVQHVNGSVGSHDGSQPIKGIFTTTPSHSPASSAIKVEGKNFFLSALIQSGFKITTLLNYKCF